MLRFERQLWRQGRERLAGVDEAGRGPLAGPVIAAAVFLPRSLVEAEEHGALEGLTDSKQLTELRREHFYRLLHALPGAEIGVGAADSTEIDEVNILQATHRAMARALAALPRLPDAALVDGRPVPGLPCPSTAIVHGDARSLLIAAASVVAKVERDAIMRRLDGELPGYGFAAHKGYGTAAHVRALLERGAAAVHRRSFRPVREAEAIRRRREAGEG